MLHTWALITVEVFCLFVVCLGEGCVQNGSTPKPTLQNYFQPVKECCVCWRAANSVFLHCWVTAASAEFTCSSKNSLVQVIFPSPPSFAVKGLCSDLQIILLTAVEVGKLRAIVVLNRWCFFKFFLWFLTSLKCGVASPTVFRVTFIHVLYSSSNSPWTHVCRCVWGVVALFYLHEMLLTKHDNHVLGKAVFYCFKQEAKNQLCWLCNFLGK